MPAFPPEPPFDAIAAGFTVRHLDRQDGAKGAADKSNQKSESAYASDIRKSACSVLDLDASSFTSGVQVHGINVMRVTEPERGRGTSNYYEGIPETDALITDLKGVPIGVFTADCVPVLLYDPIRPAVGIVHAGWRSTVRLITAEAVNMMAAEFNSNPRDLWAAIGPSIGQCCYVVGPDVHKKFSDAFDYAQDLFRNTGNESWHLDLWQANHRQLLSCGVSAQRILAHNICSSCNSEKFFSARKLGPHSGRTLSLIALRPHVLPHSSPSSKE
jgi:hypothetical protein